MGGKLKRKLPVLLLFGLFIMAAGAFLTYSEPVDSKEVSDITPTVFIHGYSGTTRSFGNMIDRFEQNNWADRGLAVYVSANGKVLISGTLKGKHNPIIQVVFANNMASITQQTKWLKSLMTVLAERYQVDQVNLVGHSMGGLASVSYLLSNQENPRPKVEKLVAIGSPFLGIQRDRFALAEAGSGAFDLQWHSSALQNMAELSHLFDTQTSVLNVAGVIGGDIQETDGLVSLESVRGLKKIVPANSYYEKVFYDTAATHVGLHEYKETDTAIAAFLWNTH